MASPMRATMPQSQILPSAASPTSATLLESLHDSQSAADLFLSQVMDSAFPAAQSAHSGGMEMALSMRRVLPCESASGRIDPQQREEILLAHILETILQLAANTLPIIHAAASWSDSWNRAVEATAVASVVSSAECEREHQSDNGLLQRSKLKRAVPATNPSESDEGASRSKKVKHAELNGARISFVGNVHCNGANVPMPLPPPPSLHAFLLQHFSRLDSHVLLLLRSNTVASRASSIQGQAFLKTCAEIWHAEDPTSVVVVSNSRSSIQQSTDGGIDAKRHQIPTRIGAIIQSLKQSWRPENMAVHFAPLFGFLGSLFGISSRRLCSSFILLQLKGLLSSSVRLGLIGPMQAQRLQWRMQRILWLQHEAKDRPALHPYKKSAASSAAVPSMSSGLLLPYFDRPLSSITNRSPLLEVLQTGHDRLWTRLFNT